MAFPHKQDVFLNWLQSDVDEYSVDINHLDQSHINAPEIAALHNTIHQEHITSDGSVNQGPQLTAVEHPNYMVYLRETYDEGMIYDQLLSELETTIYPGPGLEEEWCRIVVPVDGVVSTDAIMQSEPQQLESSSKTDYTARVSEIAADNEQETEQARDVKLPLEQEVSLNQQLHLNNLDCIELEEIQRIAGNASNSEDGNEKTRSDSQDYWLDDEENNDLYMWEDDHDGKSFSSWILYSSDDDMEAFKDILSENTSEDEPQSTAHTHTNNRSIAKPTATLKEASSSK